MKPSPFAFSPTAKPHAGRLTFALAATIAVLVAINAPMAQAQFHVRDGDKVIQRPAGTTTGAAATATTTTTTATTATTTAHATVPQGVAGSYPGFAVTTPHTTANRSNAPLSTEKDSREFRTTEAQAGIGDVAWKLQISEQQGGVADIVWGRAIHHPNGNYTVSKVEDATLTQRTFSQPQSVEEHSKTDDERQPIERRMVQLNANGRPVEVLIYDIRNQLKYRGVLIYDNRGKFMEEQLMSPRGEMVRRRVQQYDRSGNPLPLETFMDETMTDSDITLVLTRNSNPGGGSTAPASSGTQEASTAGSPAKKKSLVRRMMFWKKD